MPKRLTYPKTHPTACLRGLSCGLDKGEGRLTVYMKWYSALGLGLGCTSAKDLVLSVSVGVMWMVVIQGRDNVQACMMTCQAVGR